MLSTPIADAFAALDTALEVVGALDWDGMPVRERLESLARLETSRRRATACSSDLVGSIGHAEERALGGIRHRVIADVVRISPAEARRRLRDAAQLQPRTTLTGQSLPPELPATAKAWDAGLLDIEHLRAIQRFFRDLPEDVPPAAAEKAEAFLAEKAAELRPDQLEKVADRLAITLHPDGRFSDEYRARQRGFIWCGGQRPDGMSVGKMVATPALRAMLDTWLAKFAAPGMCNPDDQAPTLIAEPSQEVIDRDARSHGQRQHDALAALVRGQLGDPALGQHNGLPVTVIATATLEQLCSASGHAVTAGGTLLPMADVIRMASHAWHYLCVFEAHTERAIYLGRSKRIASADQRIVLQARDRGCTAPGCDMPGYLTEVHHIDPWCEGGGTDVDDMTLACGPHHRLLTAGGWRTRKRSDGMTEWIPPPALPLPGGTNSYHHPERLLPGATGGTAT
jgi:hypothetical protein